MNSILSQNPYFLRNNFPKFEEILFWKNIHHISTQFLVLASFGQFFSNLEFFK